MGLSAILVIVLLWILFTPVRLFIDTDSSRYELVQRGVFFMAVHPGEKFTLDLRIFGISLPNSEKSSEKRKPEKKVTLKKKPAGLKRSLRAWRFLVKEVIKSFQVNNLIIDIDTDDVALNAQLVPVALLASHYPVQVSTNFCGRVYLHMEVIARLNKLLWIFIRFLIKK